MPNEDPTCPMPRSKVVERYFMEHRAKLIDVAAFLDRLDRAADDAERPGSRGGQREEDFRVAAFRRAIVILQEDRPGRVKRIMEFFSDPTGEPIERAPMQGGARSLPRTISGGGGGGGGGGVAVTGGGPPEDLDEIAGPGQDDDRDDEEAGEREREREEAEPEVRYIDPHIHMISRTTDDYRRMAEAGCVAVTEPAFWAGFDRSSPQGFYDYFSQLTEFEPKRAAAHGIRHFCWICINPKEAEDPGFAREVMSFIPKFLEKPTALGVGEIGLNKNSRNELVIFDEQVSIAEKHDQLILIHTPHLEDKLKGTKLIIDALRNHARIDPGRVLIDHVEEHTVELVLDAGFWAGMTLYPETKCTPQRAADIIEMYGSERLWINSAGDWGPSDPLAVPKARIEMAARGHRVETIDTISFDNPLQFLAQSGKFDIDA